MIDFFRGCRVLAVTCSLLAFAGAPALSVSTPAVGNGRAVAKVDRVLGEARVERGGAASPIKVGRWLRRSDILKTGAGGRVSLKFKDGSRLALGGNAVLVIGNYVPERGRQSGALLLDLHKGAMRLTAAEPEKAPSKRVEVRTQAGRITARAMDVWSGPIDGKVGVLLMGGRVDVRNNAGSVVLHKKRLGTMVSDHASPPERAVNWPAEKVKQALLTVSFKRQ